MTAAIFGKTNVRLAHFDWHVLQGAATWSNWEGEQDLLLFTAYSAKGGRPFIMARAQVGEAPYLP